MAIATIILRSWCLFAMMVIARNGHAQLLDLDHYLRTGEANSPQLQDLRNQVDMLGLDSAKVKAQYGPQVNGTGQFLYAPVGRYAGYDEAITNGGLYSAVVGASVPLFTGGRANNQLEGLSAQRSSLNAGAASTLLDLQRGITAQYITVHSDQRALAFAKAQAQLLEEEERTLAGLVQRGIYAQTDLLALQVNLQAQRIAASQALALLRNDLHQLNQLCGITDTTTVALAPPRLDIPVASSLQDSPVLEQFRMDSIRNAIADRAVDVAYKPRLNATGDLGLNAITFNTIPDRFGGTAGLNLYVPIYDGAQRRLEHDRVVLREQTRKAYQEFYASRLGERSGQFQEALDRSSALLVDLQAQSAKEDRLIELYRRELESGLVRITDLFVVLSAHAATVSSLIRAEADRARIINELDHLQ